MEIIITIIKEGIFFFTYLLICCGLMKPRFAKKKHYLLLSCILALILLTQCAFFTATQDWMLVLTLLPITTYIPFFVGLYFLSDAGFFQALSAWIISYLVVFILKFFQEFLSYFITTKLELPKITGTLLSTFLLLCAAVPSVFLVLRLLRRPFQNRTAEAGSQWFSLCLPLLLFFLLLSYFDNSVMRTRAFVLLFLAALSMLWVAGRVLASSDALDRMKKAEKAAELRMQAQRREYETICEKLEAGKIYRHDLRHHLLTLEELARQDSADKILRYIGNMKGRLSDTEQNAYCVNPIVNAVLNAYREQAAEAHCTFTAQMDLPQELPFDEIDLCVLLANTLENAVNACRKIKEKEKRFIRVSARLRNRQKMILSVENACDEEIPFDKDGLPAAPASPEHGIGMRSIQAVTEKYGGFFQCKCERGTFLFHAVLFHGTPALKPAGKKDAVWMKNLISSLFLLFNVSALLVLCIPSAAQALMEAPAIKSLVQLLEERSVHAGWGSTRFDSILPVFGPETGDASPESVEELNRQILAYQEEIEETFLSYVLRKYGGYVNAETDWTVLSDDDKYFSIRLDSTINAGSSYQCSRCFTLDKESGQVLSLEDLFVPGTDYVGLISEEIIRQMKEQIQNNHVVYYIPECTRFSNPNNYFKKISPEQNFYLDSEGNLVILFDKYKVAPGSMGLPTFVIDLEIFGESLR